MSVEADHTRSLRLAREHRADEIRRIEQLGIEARALARVGEGLDYDSEEIVAGILGCTCGQLGDLRRARLTSPYLERRADAVIETYPETWAEVIEAAHYVRRQLMRY